VENVNDPAGVATAKYENNITTSGWAFITLTSNSKYSDYDQMYGAGFLEGAISRDIIYAYYLNLFYGEYNSTGMSTSVVNWINENIDFMKEQIKSNPSDPYWAHIGLILTQLAGVVDGYNSYTEDKSKKLSFMQFMLINMDGDMEDLLDALNVTSFDWSNEKAIIERYMFNSHCSVLVKVADDFSNLFAGHTTWEGYYEMVRVFKTYVLPLSVQHSALVHMFSSYPGSLSSTDDFYQLDNGLIVMETTNGIMNNSLYKAVVPKSVLSWIRAIVANKIASNGKEWVDIFSKFNSGTYNNQWIVVDTNKLVTGTRLEAGALFILEQIPGYVESADVTQILSYGYWPSYNVPFFSYIYNISGFAYYAEHYGTMFTYENNPRAEIFRRNAGNVATIEDTQQMLRYNDYLHDRLSQGNPGFAISSRFDLASGNVTNPFLARAAFGGTDSKVTSVTSVKNMQCFIQCGPSHDSNPPFEWTEAWSDVPHYGQPQVWNFGWVAVQYRM
jgi:hypothetical protein